MGAAVLSGVCVRQEVGRGHWQVTVVCCASAAAVSVALALTLGHRTVHAGQFSNKEGTLVVGRRKGSRDRVPLVGGMRGKD